MHCGSEAVLSRTPPAGAKPRALDWAFEEDVEYPAAKLVLIVMARRGNSSLSCFMTHDRIALETRLSLSTIGRAIGWLKREGLIRQVPSIPSRRARGILTYQLLVGQRATHQNGVH